MQIQGRVDLVSDWLDAVKRTDRQGRQGWAWIPELPPDPTHTAEIVCSLHNAGLDTWRHAEIEKLVRSDETEHYAMDRWEYQAVIDVAWRLRALLLFDVGSDDLDVKKCVGRLLKAQDHKHGAWSLGDVGGSASVTATGVAVLALAGTTEAGAVRRGLSFIAGTVLELGDDSPVYVSAHAATVLSDTRLVGRLGRREEKARYKAVELLMGHLEEGILRVEVEEYVRDSIGNSWRHLNLHIALRAIASAAPDLVLEPAFRTGLARLLDLQETRPDNVDAGGFRTSSEGIVTSYSTVQALEVIALVDSVMERWINPARLFDLVCRADGAHHTDAQTLATFGRGGAHRLIVNSTAAALTAVPVLLAGLTVIGLCVVPKGHLDGPLGHALLIWGVLLCEFGVGLYATARLTRIPNTRILVAGFTAFTAVVLPFVAYLIA